MQLIITALAYTGATLGVLTAIHLFFWFIIWANNTIRYKIAKHRGLGRVFRLLFLHDQDCLRKHEQQLHDFIRELEKEDKKKIES